MASALADGDKSQIISGLIAGRHKASSAIRALVGAIAELTDSAIGTLSEGSNSAGASIAGVLPHRAVAGADRNEPGLDAAAMTQADLDAVLLFGVEPQDLACADGQELLGNAGFVAALTPYTSESLEQTANLLLPTGTFAETSGTFVNCEGRWQSFSGIANPVGESRPGWKILRVHRQSDRLPPDSTTCPTEAIRDEVEENAGTPEPDNRYRGTGKISQPNGADAPDDEIDVPIYQVDSLVRRARALQMTAEAMRAESEQP